MTLPGRSAWSPSGSYGPPMVAVEVNNAADPVLIAVIGDAMFRRIVEPPAGARRHIHRLVAAVKERPWWTLEERMKALVVRFRIVVQGVRPNVCMRVHLR